MPIDQLSASVYDGERKAASHLQLVLANQYGQEQCQMFYANVMRCRRTTPDEIIHDLIRSGGEVENDALFHFEYVHSEREN